MSNDKNKEKKRWADQIEQMPVLQESVALSLIIPTYNCSEVIGSTLESVSRQGYEPLEVIVVDAGSTDRTLEIVNSYASIITRIYTVSTFHLPDMMNRGISLASNRYISFLFPGSYYISENTYAQFAQKTVQKNYPHLIYCGSIQREVKRESRIIQFPLKKELLEKGQHPATISATWFAADLFEKTGKFTPNLQLRPGYELFCRIVHAPKIHAELIDRVLVDFDYGRFSYGKVLRFASETWRVLVTHFGYKRAILWFLSVNHLVIVKGLWRRFKQILFKKQ